jgi:hypothetical protein
MRPSSPTCRLDPGAGNDHNTPNTVTSNIMCRWTLEVRGRQDKKDSCLEYTGADFKGDCTAVWVQARESWLAHRMGHACCKYPAAT